MLMSLDFIVSVPQKRWGLPAMAKKDKYRGGRRSDSIAATTTSHLMSPQTATAAHCLYSAVQDVFIYTACKRKGVFSSTPTMLFTSLAESTRSE